MTRAAILLALGACATAGTSDPALEEARARWTAQGWRHDYDVVVERQCFCPEEIRGPVRVVVRNDQVIERRYVSGGVVPPDRAQFFPAVDGMFEEIESAIADDVYRLDVEYDPENGVPRRFWVDRDERIADEESGVQVHGIEPMAP